MGFYRDQVLPRLTHLVLARPRFRRLREEVVRGLCGSVLEIGFGSGLNLPLLPEAVDSLHVVEPSRTALGLAGGRLRSARIPVAFLPFSPDVLETGDASVDAVLMTWTLCGVPDQARLSREIRRVLKPGGSLHLVEHGLCPRASTARWQRRLTPLQRRLAGGCRLDTDVPAILGAAGFDTSALRTTRAGGGDVAGFCYLGRLRVADGGATRAAPSSP